MDIAALRLRNQRLVDPDFKSPADVVAHLGAVQAQDYAAAKWAVGLRMRKATDATVERAFNEGLILRTHVMRPTWHFVPPGDIRWMLDLTSARVKSVLASYDRKHGHTADFYRRCNAIIGKALRGGDFLTRRELGSRLEDGGIPRRGQRLGHILVNAELDGLICSGPRLGKQLTYALLEKRAPKAKRLPREEALAKLALRYFTSHGPAQLGDFAWWSGLSAREAARGLALIERKLVRETADGKTYWLSPRSDAAPIERPLARLLSLFVEYAIAYKDRSDISDRRDVERMLSLGNALQTVLVLNGKAAGTWKRAIGKDKIEISLAPFRKLTKLERGAIESEAERYGKFLGLPAVVA